MSANQVVKTGIVECGPIGGMMPLCAIRQSNPTALMSTVLPPVLGPETSTVNSSEARARSNGTTSLTLSTFLSSPPDPLSTWWRGGTDGRAIVPPLRIAERGSGGEDNSERGSGGEDNAERGSGGEASNGCRPFRITSGPPPIAGAKP